MGIRFCAIGAFLFFTLFFQLTSQAVSQRASAANTASDWLSAEQPIALAKILANTSPPDGAVGSVLASPSRANPNYYFHWVRDSALTMDALLTWVEHSTDQKENSTLVDLIIDYSDFSRDNQSRNTLGGLGEPRFNVDGSPDNSPWGRPQNDGPALRAIVLTRLAQRLLDLGQESYVRQWLYDGKLPTYSVVKTDLEYVSHHWRDTCFDLWEELMGDHFYTRMVQRKALLKGADLATRMGDPGAAAWYRLQAELLKAEITRHWDAQRGIIMPTLNRAGGIDYKTADLDVAVVLGALHGDMGDGFFTVLDPRVQSTMSKLEATFKTLFPINQRPDLPGVAIGRYPEDRYSGFDASGGNPWVLATLAFAEAHYRIAADLKSQGKVSEAATQVDQGDQFVLKLKAYAGKDGSLSEQIQRATGAMTSARDLTWNYAAALTASWAR